jgi:hypothetical protein
MQSNSSEATPLAILLNRSRCTGGDIIALNARNSAANLPGFAVPEPKFNSVARGKAAAPPDLNKVTCLPAHPKIAEAPFRAAMY